jgi:multiple sugar transport system ATP-binding protein
MTSNVALAVERVSKSYGSLRVLTDISIEAAPGDFVVLLGPSGCGKSTLLHAIAGLQPIDAGQIVIDGRVVNDAPSRDRDIAMVFQSYALYPNMTVAENIAFPLKMRGVPRDAQRNKVLGVSKTLQLDALLDRRPRQLSGGQRQRVAIGRALVRDPTVFLFDEPLSNLDAMLRVEMRTEIKTLHNRIGKTIIYVTHDQVEAMTLATKIVVMNKGVILQVGSPSDIYNKPANLFVARFIGSPAITLFEGVFDWRDGRGGFKPRDGGQRLPLPARLQSAGLQGKVDAPVMLGLRPEHIRLGNVGGFACEGTVDIVEPTGPEDILILTIFGQRAIAKAAPGAAVSGQRVMFDLDLDRALLFDVEGGQRIE